jgi:uroporphyrin-III C-methyltransferase/precorrin-2 dehydrogenase/sirohydrochlorin ferrochelatase
MPWHSLPVFVRVSGRPVILLGEGEAADAKRRLLEQAGAEVMADHPDARLAVVAIEDEEDAHAAVAALRARGLLVNAVDRPHLCDWTTPAIVDRDPVLVAVGTGGVSAGLAAALRQRLETALSPRLGRLAAFLHAWRDELRQAFPEPAARRRAIAAALAPGGILDLDDPFLEDPFWLGSLGRKLARGDGWGLSYVRPRSPDPDELTLREARLLANADRVLHRPDVPPAILARVRADAPRIVSDAAPARPEPGLTVFVEMAA